MIVDYSMRFDDRDEFDRKPIAVSIKKLLDGDNGATFFPILIDGDWGAGKTEFLFKLRNYILEPSGEAREPKGLEGSGKSERRYSISYINSFTADYYDDPFMIIVREIYSLLAAKGDAKDLKDFFDIIKEVTPTLIGIGLDFTVSTVPGGNTIKKGVQIASNLYKAVQRAETVAFESRLKTFLQSANELQKFHNVLSQTIESIGGKYILIIDELDRCKPDYSLKLLEMIKHLLNVKGLYVIFGANSKYLEASISNKYMKSEESSKSLVLSEEYLSKFYNLRVFLTAKREVWAPEQLNIDNNYQYFKDSFFGDGILPRSFSSPFKIYESLGLAFENCRDQGIKDPYRRYDEKYHWDILNKQYIESAEAIKIVLTALFGDMELRQREKVKQNIALLYELNPNVLFEKKEEDILKENTNYMIDEDRKRALQLLEAPLAILIGISMLRDNSPLVPEILSADTFIYKPQNIDRSTFSGNLLNMSKIQKYLTDKNIPPEVVRNVLTGFVGRDRQRVFYEKENPIDDYLRQEYPLNTLISTLESLKGLQVR